MKTRHITIKNGNIANHLLKLSHAGHTKAKKSEEIIWKVAKRIIVESITCIEEKKNSYNIFSTPPHPEKGVWKGKICSTAPVGAEYNYTIHWKAKGSTEEHKHDPKISIRPSTVADFIK